MAKKNDDFFKEKKPWSIVKDDLVERPYCHRMRDRKAYYCRYCNDSTWEPSTPKEFKEMYY